MSILNLGTKGKSWWYEHGIGCHIDNQGETTTAKNVTECLIQYFYVEVIQAAIHCLLAASFVICSIAWCVF